MIKTSARIRIALSIYCVISAIHIWRGLKYYFSNEVMLYHSQAIGVPWHEIELGVQAVLLALMKVAGAGWIVLGVFTLVLAHSALKKRDSFARWTLPVGTLLFYLATFFPAWAVYQRTAAPTPWGQALVGFVFAFLALLVDAPWSSRARDSK